MDFPEELEVAAGQREAWLPLWPFIEVVKWMDELTSKLYPLDSDDITDQTGYCGNKCKTFIKHGALW